MCQVNKGTGKEREIRCPHGWKAPSAPIVPSGPTMTIQVPPGSQGKTIQVPHPKDKKLCFSVNVPAGAKANQAMLVPVPEVSKCQPAGSSAKPAAETTTQGAVLESGKPGKKSGWSTGAKVAAGVGGVAVVGGAAVLGTEIAEHGADATFDAIGDGLGDAGEAIGDAAGDAGDFIMTAADDVGDFIMDLF